MTSTRKQSPPFRAEHIGSLLRPPTLRDAILSAQPLPKDDLTTLTNAAVSDIVAKQLALGLHAPTDGEYQRIIFIGSFHTALDGFDDVPSISQEAFRTYLPDVADFLRRGEAIPYTTICTGKIRHPGQHAIYEGEFLNLQEMVGGKEGVVPKLTLVSPLWYYTLYRKGHAYPAEAYKNDDEYLADLGAAFRKEIDLLYEIGCRNIQVDDPYLTGECLTFCLGKVSPRVYYGKS